MSEPPRIVATLTGRGVDETRRQILIARDAGADLGEVRFDLWEADERARATELFPSPLPLLATLRSRREGGFGPDDPEQRAHALERFARLPFTAIDLELERDRTALAGLPPGRPPLRILSRHFPEGAELPEVADSLRPGPREDAIRKVVVAAPLRAVLRELLPSLPPAGDGPRLLLTTGGSGELLRAWSRRLDYPLVYGSLPVGSGSPPIEPSQLPVDRLRRFFAGEPDAPLFAVVGHPIAHSLSPYLHDRWMRAAGCAGLYLALDIESESELIDSLPDLAAGGFRGLNVTHPWKSAALAGASRVSRGAELCGVANCLTFQEGEVEAENTDLAAILRRLEELRRDGAWDGRELAVVGSGGSASATLAAARELGSSAFVLARDAGRARTLASRFGASVLETADARAFPLVVHATPVGRAGAGDLGVPLGPMLSRGGRLLDWVYAPDLPDVRDAAARSGAEYEDGWRLLVYQAAASFALWWDAAPPNDEIEAVLAEGPCVA